jgi:hypothetical protein
MNSSKTCFAQTVVLKLIAFAFLCSAAAAQPQPVWDPKRPDPAYTLSRVAGGAVLVHNSSGDAWWLLIEEGEKKDKTKATWLPIDRVENYGAVAKWLLAQEKDSTRSLVDVELAFAKSKLKEARNEYGSRHPVIIELTRDVRSLEKVRKAMAKQRSRKNSGATESE